VTRVIGIDHGSMRVGVAVGDTETGMAFARPALRGRSLAALVDAVAALASSEGAQIAVVGLPYNMDGSEGPQASTARGFGDALREAGLEVVYEDERLSSWEASHHLAAAGRRADRRSGELDSAAAQVILQQYLDARRPPPRPPEETQ
jgi:putative holliday junction resolvase